MAEIVSLAAAREERTPHWVGAAHCVGCRQEWEAVAPIGTMNLECPSCGLPKGVPKYPFGAQEGDAVLVCDCGCEALVAYKRQGKFYTKCMACGTDLTHAFYEGRPAVILSFASAQAKRRKAGPRSGRGPEQDPWCGPCSDAADERQYLTPHVHRLGFGQSETRYSCPRCGSEFL